MLKNPYYTSYKFSKFPIGYLSKRLPKYHTDHIQTTKVMTVGLLRHREKERGNVLYIGNILY